MKTGYVQTLRARLRSALRVTAATTLALLLLWSIAFPSFSQAHPPGSHPDESAARATLSILADAQQQFRARKAPNRDGEFGWFSQLTATDPPLLSPRLGDVHEGRVERGGYVFQLWLPAANGTWATEGSSTPIDVDAAKQRWCAYAWPRDQTAARRVLFVDESGRILRAKNEERRYSGHTRPVPVDAALPSSMRPAPQDPGTRRGRDGALWSWVR